MPDSRVGILVSGIGENRIKIEEELQLQLAGEA